MSFIKKVHLFIYLSALLFNNNIHATNYYLNDNDIGPNVWCSSPGDDLQNGTSPATPKLTFASLFSSYTLVSNDIVYVDTGVYNENVTLPISDFGAQGKYLVFQGSGINGQTTWITSFHLAQTKWVKVAGFKLDSANTTSYGLWADNSTNILLCNNIILSNLDGGCRLNYCIQSSIYSNMIFLNHGIPVNGWGIIMNACFSNLIMGNICSNNGSFGISLEGGSAYNIIRNNRSVWHMNNAGMGIIANNSGGSSHDNQYINNYLGNNRRNISIENSYNNLIRSNIIRSAVEAGIASLGGSHNNIYEYNDCRLGGTWSIMNFTADVPLHDEIIRYNKVYKSTSQGGIRFEGRSGISCNNIIIRSNICASNTTGGIVAASYDSRFINLTSSTIEGNICFDNTIADAGIILKHIKNTVLRGNICYNNRNYGGISIWNSTNLLLSSNKCYSNSYGMYNLFCSLITNDRCIFFYNDWAGMQFDNINNSLTKNCTIISNQGYGMSLENYSDNNILKNSIIAGNGIIRGYSGLSIQPNCVNSILSYNDIFGNLSNTTNSSPNNGGGNYAGCTPGPGDFSPSLDPVFISRSSFSDPQFLFLSNMSPCIDTGDPADDGDPLRQGSHIDRGAYESPYFVDLTLSKVASVTLNHADSAPIPGSQVFYKIKYHNQGTGAALQVEIVDTLPNNMGYIPGSITTDSIHTGGSVVVNCYDGSTWQTLSWGNANPVQIKKIRWRISSKTSVGPETGSGTYPNTDSGIVAYQLYIK